MLTLDDCNTILEKYGKIGFWYTVDLTQFDSEDPDKIYQQDFLTIKQIEGQVGNLWLIDTSGILVQDFTAKYGFAYDEYGKSKFLQTSDERGFTIGVHTQSNTIKLYLVPKLSKTRVFDSSVIVPSSSLRIPLINGRFNDKIYFSQIGSGVESITLDREPTPTYEDENGTFIRLPLAKEYIIGTKDKGGGAPSFTEQHIVSFIKLKSIPQLSVNTLYKGTSQTITLYDSTNDRTVTDFQASYNGRKLKDNKIELPYDAEDIIDLVIELTDPVYPETRLKLKAPTAYCVCTSQAEVETAISKGVRTMIVDNNGTSVVLDEMELNDMLFIESKITVNESTLNNCKILSSQYIDNGQNTLTNTEIDGTAITGDHKSTYTDCNINDSTITDMEIHISGAITNSVIEDSLIITDNPITLTGNTFNGGYDKTYFPSVLYLTGEYTIKRNVFTLEAEYEEPEFNMCLIKAVTFNPNQFIIDNILNLNITYEDEDPETLYYNIVDDDKIKAVKL